MMRLASLLLCLIFLPALGIGQDAAKVTTAPRVRVVTNAGNFVIELDPGRAPLTVAAFLKYVKQGFYSGLVFHRVVAGFIAQAGAFTVDLEQKPVTETISNESGNGLSNLRGSVAMARGNEPHSATSQFYINLADNIDLNPRPTRWGYTVFGKVIEGMEVVDDIGHRPTAGGGPFNRNVPVEPIIIDHIEVLSE
jgi:peptidyl-prolyl cis-trans isomerase A (cyclophilin A)